MLADVSVSIQKNTKLVGGNVMVISTRIIPLMLSLVLMLSLFAGCGNGQSQQPSSTVPASQAPESSDSSVDYSNLTIEEKMAEDAKNPITFSVTFPSSTPPDDDAIILAEFAKRTGVTLDLNPIFGEPYEKLGMMLASNSLSDIMIIPNEQILNQYKESDQILDILPYLKNNAPTVYDIYNRDVNYNLIDQYMEDDGRLLYLMNDVGLLRSADEEHEDPNDPDADLSWLPWMTSLFVVYPDIDEYAGKPMATIDDWYNAMVNFKAKNPQDYATSMSSEYGEWMLRAFASLYGYKVELISGTSFFTKDDMNYQSIARLPEAVDAMKFLNKLYKEGLMDPEGPIQNLDAFTEKMSAGRVFSFLGYYDKVYEANDAFAANADWSDSVFIPQQIAAPGVSHTWQANIAYVGYQCTMLTESHPDPDRYFRLLEYAFSDEGMALNGWGIEGEHYTVDAQGKYQTLLDLDTQGDYIKKIGLNFFQTLASGPVHLANGNWARCWDGLEGQMTPLYQELAKTPYNYFRTFAGHYWGDPSTLNIVMPPESPEAITSAKIKMPINDMVCKAVMANSDEEIERIYSETMAQLELDGLSALEKAIQDKINSKR